MTEFESFEKGYMLLDSMMSITSALHEASTIIWSFIFGYLLVAHFIGKSLSTAQAVVLTVLYLSATLRLVNHSFHYLELGNEAGMLFFQHIGISPQPNFAEQAMWLSTTPAWYFLYISASLYYMWSVRHPKAE
jgi:hypothetical protein